jgi:hypothetical protein
VRPGRTKGEGLRLVFGGEGRPHKIVDGNHVGGRGERALNLGPIGELNANVGLRTDDS